MKNFFYFLIFLSFLPTRAQVVFCPPGAEWSYNFSEYWTQPAFTNEKIKFVGDSIIGQDTLKKLVHSKSLAYDNSGANCSSTLLKQKGDTVFFRNNCTQNNWQILYNFGALAGSTWTNALFNTSFTAAVISVDTSLVNGFILKELTVNYTRKKNGTTIVQGVPPQVKITERLGCSNFLFNFYIYGSSDMDEVFRNLCYKDDEIGLVQFTPFSCDYSNPVGLSELNSNDTEIELFPNPVEDRINIKISSPSENIYLEIRNVAGILLKKVELQSRNHVAELNLDLKNGMYFVSINSENGKQRVEKIIVRR